MHRVPGHLQEDLQFVRDERLTPSALVSDRILARIRPELDACQPTICQACWQEDSESVVMQKDIQ